MNTNHKDHHYFEKFRYSIDGVKAAYRTELAFRLEIFFAVPILVFGFFITRSLPEFVSIVCAYLILIILELINTAIEAVVDRISLDLHDLSKKAKDIGSAIVFLGIAVNILLHSTYLYLNVLINYI